MLNQIKKFLKKTKTKDLNDHKIDSTLSNLDIKIKTVKINIIKFKNDKQ